MGKLEKKNEIVPLCLNVLDCYDDLGSVYATCNCIKKAEKWYLLVLKKLDQFHSNYEASAKSTGIMASVNYHLGSLYATDDKEKAKLYYSQTCELFTKICGEISSEVADTIEALASLYFAHADYMTAEKEFLRVKEIREQIYENDHPDLERIYRNLKNVYIAMENHEEAQKYYIKSKEMDSILCGDSRKII